MGAEYTVQDNFLPIEVFNSIKFVFMGANFPWYISDSIVGKRKTAEDPLFGYQFIHLLYSDKIPQSHFYPTISPILEALNPSALVRIKVNLTPVRPVHYEAGMHTDIDNFDGYTSIYYINNNNGYTKFSDGAIVESVENRFVTFRSTQPHTAASCTDQRYRCVMNLNYFKWSNSK
jgi:hypothetical protein